MSLETQFVQALSGLLYASATAGIAVVTPKIKDFLNTHTNAKSAKLESDALEDLSKVVESVVADFNQRIVNDAKTKQAFTQDLAEQTKKDAVAAVKSQGPQFIKLISGDVDGTISALIEQEVAKAKGGVK